MLPRVLKNMSLFIDGESYIGRVDSVTLPKLSRKMESWRAGGMAGAASIDLGFDDDALKSNFSIGGHVKELLLKVGAVNLDGVQMRFAGAYQDDASGNYSKVEIIMRGRFQEVDRGDQKVGEKGDGMKVSVNNTYYKETVDGTIVQEIDALNFIHNVNGVDMLKEQRDALGI